MDENVPDDRSDFERYFKFGVFGLAMIFLVISAFQLYLSLDRIIYTWFEHQYIWIAKAVVNLIILGLSIYVIKLYFVNR